MALCQRLLGCALLLLMATPSRAATVTVDCAAGQSVQQAINQAVKSQPLTVIVQGTCTENITLQRDDVTLQGNTGTIAGTLAIVSSSRIVLRGGLTFAGSPGDAITARLGTSLQVLNVRVRDYALNGIGVGNGSTAFVDGATVIHAPTADLYAVGAFDGSNIRVLNSTIRSRKNVSFTGAAVIAGRGSTLRIAGGSTIENTGISLDPTRALAVWSYDSSNVRIDGAGNVVNGNMLLEDQTGTDLRAFTLTGNALVKSRGSLNFGSGFTLSGNVLVGLDSLLEVYSGSGGVVNGTVTCERGGKVGVPQTPVIPLVNCPQL